MYYLALLPFPHSIDLQQARSFSDLNTSQVYFLQLALPVWDCPVSAYLSLLSALSNWFWKALHNVIHIWFCGMESSKPTFAIFSASEFSGIARILNRKRQYLIIPPSKTSGKQHLYCPPVVEVQISVSDSFHNPTVMFTSVHCTQFQKRSLTKDL